MCGDELPASAYAHRFGALAVMNPTSSPTSSHASSPASSPTLSPEDVCSVSGSIAFFNETDHDCQVATHIRFLPTSTLPANGCPCLSINIHDFGDINLALDQSQSTPILRRLKEPLHLHVGDDKHGNRGIIGQKVTMYCGPETLVAEGIVGYNSLPRVNASL